MNQGKRRLSRDACDIAMSDAMSSASSERAWNKIADQVRDSWSNVTDMSVALAGQARDGLSVAGSKGALLADQARNRFGDVTERGAMLADQARGRLGGRKRKNTWEEVMDQMNDIAKNATRLVALASLAELARGGWEDVNKALKKSNKAARKQAKSLRKIDLSKASFTMPRFDKSGLAKARLPKKGLAKAGQFLVLAKLGEGTLSSTFAKKRAQNRLKSQLERVMQRQSRRNQMPAWPWIAGFGLGAAAMFLGDPQMGRRRRALLRDQIAHLQASTADTLGAASTDMANRAQGLGHMDSPSEIRNQAGQLIGLRGANGEMRSNWPPAMRVMASVAGGMLAVTGLRSGGVFGMARSALGLGLLARGAMNKPFGQLFGMQQGQQQAIDVQKTLTVHAPVSEVYRFWSHFENFPRFMSHVIEVRDLGGNRSHWVVEGPAGTPVEWYARTTSQIPDRVLSWESEPGSMVGTTGQVRFSPAPDGGTQIDINMSYTPPAGIVGHAVAAFFGSDPKQAMDVDLQRFKTLIEEGQTTAHGQQVSREEISSQAGE